ncbi:restriction endonuclease subunit S [Myxococcota bacterium]|nr:restriction endonuclease subunit S [Myxococcota bacterium]MBU1381453.1 restriction endonuclease subunit S [Myxococcota bacterium]MBU1495669.1 restriction endonuclease subunit S [Myxococcota bacterium]
MHDLIKYFDIAFDAPDGIKKLREIILSLAMQGKLVPQNPSEGTASDLLKEIEKEKKKLIKEGKIKPPKPLPPIKPEEIPHEIPDTWQWVRLGEVGVYNYGSTVCPENILPDSWVLDLEDIEKDTSKIVNRFKYRERMSKSNKNSFYKGDLLYGKLRPYLNKVIVADDDGYCTTEIVSIFLFSNISRFFFLNCFKAAYFKLYIDNKMYGVKMPRLGTDDANLSLHPLPPLAEQHRIVKKIESLMALCDALEELKKSAAVKLQSSGNAAIEMLLSSGDEEDFNRNWTFIRDNFEELFSTPENIKSLKKAILQLAVMGKLVPQNPSEGTASNLLKEIEKEKKKLIKEGKIKPPKPLPPIKPEQIPHKIPNTWQWVRLGEVASKVTDGDHKTPPRLEEGYRLLSAKNVRDGYLNFENCDLISEIYYLKSRERCLPEYGDLLIVSVGGTIGRSSLVPEDSKFALVRSVALIKPLFLNSKFLKNIMDSEILQSQIHLKKRGGAQPCLYLSEIERFYCPLPPLAEQHRIVKKIESLMTVCEALEESIQTKTKTQTTLLQCIR